MKKWIAPLAGVALALSLQASVFACNTSEGDYQAANTQKNQLTVKVAGGTAKTFTLKAETKITLNGKEVALTDLKAGDKLKVDHESDTDVLRVIAERA